MAPSAALPVTPTHPHPYDHYWREGQPLRPLPPRCADDALWTTVRRNAFAEWMDWHETPAENEITRMAADHLWQGDELMDGVVAAFRKIGQRRGRVQMEGALDHGIDAVADPPPELVALFDQLDHPPAWYDRARWERGREFWADASSSGMVAMTFQDGMATLVGAEVSSATGATGRFVRDTLRRGSETVRFFHSVSVPGASDRNSPEFKDIVRVRLMHAQARSGLRRSWGDHHFAHHGNPISNSTTLNGAITFALLPALFDHRHGRFTTTERLDDLMHFWAYIGHLMGVAPELIPQDAHDGMVAADYMLAHHGGPTSYTEEMAGAAFEKLQGRSRAVSALALPPLLGAVAYATSPELASAAVRSQLGDNLRLEPWMTMTRWCATVSVRSRAISDRLPLADRRRVLRTRFGSPTMLVAARLTRALATRFGPSGPAYSHHEATPDTAPGCPVR